MPAGEGDTVEVHYTGRLENGEVFDSSRERGPIKFTVGGQQVVPGFEDAVKGMEKGESRTVEIPPTEAYGERDERLVRQLPRAEVAVEDLKPGHVLQLQAPDGQAFQGIVTDVSDAEVTLDFNHFLAGRTLVFELELVDIGS